MLMLSLNQDVLNVMKLAIHVLLISSVNSIKFSTRNNMIPDFDKIPLEIKKCFEELTAVEEMYVLFKYLIIWE